MKKFYKNIISEFKIKEYNFNFDYDNIINNVFTFINMSIYNNYLIIKELFDEVITFTKFEQNLIQKLINIIPEVRNEIEEIILNKIENIFILKLKYLQMKQEKKQLIYSLIIFKKKIIQLNQIIIMN